MFPSKPARPVMLPSGLPPACPLPGQTAATVQQEPRQASPRLRPGTGSTSRSSSATTSPRARRVHRRSCPRRAPLPAHGRLQPRPRGARRGACAQPATSRPISSRRCGSCCRSTRRPVRPRPPSAGRSGRTRADGRRLGAGADASRPLPRRRSCRRSGSTAFAPPGIYPDAQTMTRGSASRTCAPRPTRARPSSTDVEVVGIERGPVAVERPRHARPGRRSRSARAPSSTPPGPWVDDVRRLEDPAGGHVGDAEQGGAPRARAPTAAGGRR